MKTALASGSDERCMSRRRGGDSDGSALGEPGHALEPVSDRAPYSVAISNPPNTLGISIDHTDEAKSPIRTDGRQMALRPDPAKPDQCKRDAV
jgi:hypothetical protein